MAKNRPPIEPVYEPSTATAATVTSWGENLRQRAEKTKNPLYIWEAILNFTAYDMPLPDWCIAHLRTVAINLFDLMHGVDPATVPVRAESDSEADFAQRSMATRA
jgi:hypothetical protein